MINKINKKAYADMYGPTVGDKIRLADTNLIIEIEKDFASYGEEVKFGGGKVIRDGMGQSQLSNQEGAVDTVITNATIIDYWGIIKADIGIIEGNFRMPTFISGYLKRDFFSNKSKESSGGNVSFNQGIIPITGI